MGRAVCAGAAELSVRAGLLEPVGSAAAANGSAEVTGTADVFP